METETQRALLEQAVTLQYEVLRLLGEGGMGSVYLARERLLERLVAIKVLRSELVHGDARERFIREARTAAKLTHPHIVPLYSFGQAADTLYYIMGFVEGESLEDRLARAPRLSVSETRRVLSELADALEYAHSRGVVHRDIKPDNVLLERTSARAILTDFGIAKVDSGGATITRTGMVVGTPLYMSPEQAAGDREVDGRADLYSLGIMGYRMLTGRLPFEGKSFHDVLIKQATETPAAIDTFDGDIPEELASAVMRCLEKVPSERWPTAAAFQRALIADVDDSIPPVPARTGRARLAPPSGWRGSWPQSLRSAGDVWPRLPTEVRHARAMSGAFRGAFLVLLVALAISAVSIGFNGTMRPMTAVADAGGLCIVSALWLSASSARTRLDGQIRRLGIAQSHLSRLLTEPTTGSKYWRNKELAQLMSPSTPVGKESVDSAEGLEYSTTTPTHSGMFDHIDPRSPTPLYAQIATRLKVAIAAGELAPGEALPSVRTLASRLRINPATVVQAYRDLELEGLVSTRHGAGTFVQDIAPDRKIKDRAAEATRLVQNLVAQAGSIGITTAELRAAIAQELTSPTD